MEDHPLPALSEIVRHGGLVNYGSERRTTKIHPLLVGLFRGIGYPRISSARAIMPGQRKPRGSILDRRFGRS